MHTASSACALPKSAPSITRPELIEPALIDRKAAAAMTGHADSTFRKNVADGLIPGPAWSSGRHKLWCVEELRQWAAAGCPEVDAWIPMWTATRRQRNVG